MAHPQAVQATAAALEAIGRLEAAHGPLMFFPSGGCRDGTSPTCSLTCSPGAAEGCSHECLDGLRFVSRTPAGSPGETG